MVEDQQQQEHSSPPLRSFCFCDWKNVNGLNYLVALLSSVRKAPKNQLKKRDARECK